MELKVYKTTRRNGIDVLRFICAFMVILIHSEYPLKTLVDPFNRIAVPLFFAITGFFYAQKEKCTFNKEQLKKIIKILLIADIIYFFNKFLYLHLSFNYSIGSAIRHCVIDSVYEIITFFVFNVSQFAGHLWYLYALIYVLCIVSLIGKKFRIQNFYFLIPVLFGLNIIFGNYAKVLLNKDVPVFLTRNFFTMGLPSFLMGHYIWNHQKHIITYPNNTVVILLIVSLITVSLENRYLLCTLNCIVGDCFISTPFMAFLVFVMILNNEKSFHSSFFTPIGIWARKYTLFVYILHPIFVDALKTIVQSIGVSALWKMIIEIIAPFAIFFISSYCGFVIYKLCTRVSILSMGDQ